MESFQVLVAYSLFFSLIPSFHALDTIAPGNSITSNETLVSADGTFEAGFFSVDSEKQFLGMWYKNLSPRTYVWVANRDAPLENSSGVLQVTNGGVLVILNSTGATVWNSSASTTTAKNPVAQLMDTGNLVVRDANNTNDILWQSFDYPADTLLAGMKLRTNRLTGEHTSMTSWRNIQDPSPGDYSVHIDTRGFPQSVISKGGQLMYRLGSWNGKLFSGVPWETLSTYFSFSLVITQEEVTYGYELLDSTMITRYTVSLSGLVERYTWSNRTQRWEIFSAGPSDQCDNYKACGPNSNCDTSQSSICECLNGFVPKFQEKWDSNTRDDGCVRRTNLSCNNEDGFLTYTGMKLPDTSSSWYDEHMNLEECKQECLKNCSCSAYANLYVNDGGSGCLLWFDDIVDTRIKNAEGQDLYVRLAASELDDINNDSQLNKKQVAGILVGCILFATGIVILGGILYIRRKKIQKQGNNDLNQAQHDTENKKEEEEMDVPMFDLPTILNATNYFSVSNKLGEGGFGPVYKGVLANGQEIAVKRLSRSSGQGPTEFKNEAVLFANLQHRNLVKLLGCCIQNDERLLIYEFMANRSLDNFIFDQTRSDLLHWTKRFQIVNGIARGLLYLHQDSRLRIIHRDLKTSNILLDKNMNPKISDFGLARIFAADEVEANTKRVVGTHGYMPPEYAVHGSFSVKSDVFSFGVIVLEIVSGRKNREFFDATHRLNLLGYAWRLWNEERPLELIDESLGDSVTPAEVLRCIHIGLLCVQERAEDRPDMSSVVLMLNGEKSLPHPREPGFYPHEETSSSGKYSTNEISISLLDAR